MKDHYLNQMQYTPRLSELLSEATLQSTIKTASDYSYAASSYAGDHYRLAGDAAGTRRLVSSYFGLLIEL